MAEMCSRRFGVSFFGALFSDSITVTKAFPKPGETIKGVRHFTDFGGKIGNQAVMCMKLMDIRHELMTPDTVVAVMSFVGCLGGDDIGERYYERLRSLSINVDDVEIVPNISTGMASITVNESNGENMIIVTSGANDHVKDDSLQKANQKSQILVIGLELSLRCIFNNFRNLKKANSELSRALIVLNAAPIPPPENVSDFEILHEILRESDVICVNEHELKSLVTNKYSNLKDEKKLNSENMTIEALCRCFMNSRFILDSNHDKVLIVTLGKRGASYCCSSEKTESDVSEIIVEHCDLLAVGKLNGTDSSPSDSIVLDTSGAGDAFVGCLVFLITLKMASNVCYERGEDMNENFLKSNLIHSLDWRRTVELCCLMASNTTRRFGTQSSYPTSLEDLTPHEYEMLCQYITSPV